MAVNPTELSRARDSRAAIEKLYIEMRHLFNRGIYRNLGGPGEVLTDALLTLSPEIYGSVADPNKVELEGLIYVIDRLPRGVEECRYIKLISEEGYADSGFEVIIPHSRRRNCYRIDDELMLIEVTRGRSEIYDILTHLTFLFMEANKIMEHALDEHGQPTREWKKLEAIVTGKAHIHDKNREVAFSYLSSLLGRSFEETRLAFERLDVNSRTNSGLFHIVYGLGRQAMAAELEDKDRLISFSPSLRERIGHHIYGERWAKKVKTSLMELGMLDRPLHLVSANMHSFMNCLYGWQALKDERRPEMDLVEMALELSKPENTEMRRKVEEYADFKGMQQMHDNSGTYISVQIIDTTSLDPDKLHPQLSLDREYIQNERPVLLVMDYAFGEQAFETMDELLKPFKHQGKVIPMPVASVNIMGKAGILEGGKGDIMLPTAHIFEGTADNYPIDNDFDPGDFEDHGLKVLSGPMITVLGTSLQNRDVLSYFKESSWDAIGLEMEGAHYQKAVQAAARVRQHVNEKIITRYAYYASDNPLISGSTLASGSLGMIGVKPTYLITLRILQRLLDPHRKHPFGMPANELTRKPSQN